MAAWCEKVRESFNQSIDTSPSSDDLTARGRQMLLNWFLSSVSEDSHLKNVLSHQDLRTLGIQYCTHLVAAGVLRQISDKDAPTEHTFKPNLMYYWSHTEMPVSQPVTPGRLEMAWPPEDQQKRQNQFTNRGDFDADHSRQNNEDFNDIEEAKNVISKLKRQIQELEYQLKSCKLNNQLEINNKNLQNTFVSISENLLSRDQVEVANKEVQTDNHNENNRLDSKSVITTSNDDNHIRTNVNIDPNLGLSKLGYKNEFISKEMQTKTELRSDKIENYCKLNKSRDSNKIYQKEELNEDGGNDNKLNGNRDLTLLTKNFENLNLSLKSAHESKLNVTSESSSEASFLSTTNELMAIKNNKSSGINSEDDDVFIFCNTVKSPDELSLNVISSDDKKCSKPNRNESPVSILNTEFSKSNNLSQPVPPPPPPLPGMSPSPPPMPGTEEMNSVKLTNSSKHESTRNSSTSVINFSPSSLESPHLVSQEQASMTLSPPTSPCKTHSHTLSDVSSLSSAINKATQSAISTPVSSTMPPPLSSMPCIILSSPSMAVPPPPPMPEAPTIPGMGPPPPPMPGMGPAPPLIPGMGPPPPPMPGMGPPPPPMPGMGPPPPPMPVMGPPPPPMPGMGPPPPPPMPGIGPPPPPMPGMGPPPPPLPGMGPPPPPFPGMGPPPPPMSGLGSGTSTAGIPPPPPPGMTQTGPVPFPAPPAGGWNMQRATLRKSPIKPVSPMKPLYWTRILATPTPPTYQGEADSAALKPLWLEIDEAKLDNIDEFTDLFSRQVVKAPVKKKVEVKTKIQPIKILDSKRSQNVGILAQSLHVEFTEIENAIYNFDTSVVSLEALQQIYELRATKEELSMIKEHLASKSDIPLDKPETFLHDLSGIHSFAERISCFTFQAEFDDAVNTIMHKLDNLKHTCEFLMTSESLKLVFAIILTLGNYMNGGNCQRGQADGFGLEILAKLKDVKSKLSNVTLLHFIVTTYMRLCGGALSPACVLPVPEPGDVARAAALDFADVAASLNTLRKNLDDCTENMQKVITFESTASQKEDNNENDKNSEATKRLEVFKEKMTTFLNAAEDKLKTENENMCECRNKFIATVKFYQYTPKVGKLEDCEPKEFFSMWTSFCSDFKDIYKKEEQTAIKEKLKETKKQQCERKANTQPKKEGGLKARLQKLSSSRK